ncbi:unnamed protein product [Notodromas monacha]|uniref:Lysophospholipid acyltransferase 5 n=1 Tax=Notodromas monacha TaxID=399045 RepID=A0A7R9BWM8_9CRUS|nr:unnamed protein product [Notodromas monacha]CAG0922016.1 unnamed protein product [Notodromas monacha]
MGLMTGLADSLGANESMICLLIALLLGYPAAGVHRYFVRPLGPGIQNLYFFLAGSLIVVFCFGWGIAHCLFCLGVQYVILLVWGKTVVSPMVSMAFQMMYLLWGYWRTESDLYDITWTLPHCVLTLRLIAVAFDLWDGQMKVEKMSEEQKHRALWECPSLPELCGHAFFPASIMVGPQFSMRRYQSLVHGDFEKKQFPPPWRLALGRLGLGMVYSGIFVMFSAFLPWDYPLSDEFLSRPLWQKIFLIGVWGKLNLMKYVACWLITEGACMFSGLSFNGQDESGNPKWDGCRNIHVVKYETATEFQQMIHCFNTNTNSWVSCYVFKRLKVLNNKHVSHVCALLFLAVWHGLHLGYYVMFLNEFLMVTLERQVYAVMGRNPEYVKLTNSFLWKLLTWPFKAIWLWVGISYALIPFLLLTTHKWWFVYKSLWFWFHGVLLIGYPLAKMVLASVLGVNGRKYETDKKTA